MHSPVDDLESFFWVALWSVLFNEGSGEKHWEAERDMREALLNNQKDTAMHHFYLLASDRLGNNVTRCFEAVILGWWREVKGWSMKWAEEVRKEGAGGEHRLRLFHRFALRGVLDLLGVLEEHWGDIGRESWTPSGLST